MTRLALIIIFYFTIADLFYDNTSAQNIKSSDTIDSMPRRPDLTIGVGGGITSFYGNIGQNKINDPVKFKDGFSIDIQKNFSRHLGLDFFITGVRLYGYENSIGSNLNFLSSTFNEGLMIRYDLGQKKHDQFITPFLGIGISILSFNTKSDLKDAEGNNYYYWTD